MRRFEALKCIMQAVGDELVVSNIGHPSQELYQIKDRPENFYMLGAMGLALPVGLGLAMSTSRKVLVIDGDGAITMNLGALATLGSVSPGNLVHVIIDNGANGSTGFQPSFTAGRLRLQDVAEACGVPNVRTVTREQDIAGAVAEALAADTGAWVIVVKTDVGMPDGVTPIPLSGAEVKARFMQRLSG